MAFVFSQIEFWRQPPHRIFLFENTMPSRLPHRKSKIYRRLRFERPVPTSIETARQRLRERDKFSVLFGGVEIVLRDLKIPPRCARSKEQWDGIREGAKLVIAAVRASYGNKISKIILHNGALVQVFSGSSVAKPIPPYANHASSKAFVCRTSLGGPLKTKDSREEEHSVGVSSDTFVDNTPKAVQTLDTDSLDLKELTLSEWDNMDILEEQLPSSLRSSPCASPKAASAAALFSSEKESENGLMENISDGVLCGVDDLVFETFAGDDIMDISEVCV